MDMNINANAAVQRSALVAPTLGGAKGGLCPATGFRRVDAYPQVTSQVVGDAGMATGHRSWRYLLT